MSAPMAQRFLHRARGLALVGVLGSGLAIGLIVRPVGATIPPEKQQLVNQVAELVQQDGHQYPAVVARVNGQPITGKELAQRVAIVQQSQARGLDKTNPTRTALEQLIADQVLLQSAGTYGIAVSTDEAQAYAQAQQQLAAQAKDIPAQEMVSAEAASLGVAPAQYFTDPRIVEVYRRGIIRGRMRAQIAASLPVAQRGDAAAVQAAVLNFAAQGDARIERLIAP